MLVECEHHGHAAGVQISPDLVSLVASGTLLPDSRQIIYNYDDEPYIRIVVSALFAATHGLGQGGTFELPDEYPAWFKELPIVCEKCLDKSIRA